MHSEFLRLIFALFRYVLNISIYFWWFFSFWFSWFANRIKIFTNHIRNNYNSINKLIVSAIGEMK